MIDTVYLWLQHQITQNDVFAGLLGGSVVASVLFGLRSVPGRLWQIYLYQFTVELVVRDVDDSFMWINEWLSKQSYSKRSRRLSIRTMHDRDGDHWTVSAGFGRHYFWHQGRLLCVERSLTDAPASTGQQRESFNLRMATRDQSRMRALIQEARSQRDEIDRTDVWTFEDYWSRTARRIPRPIDSVILPDDQMSRITERVDWFEKAQPWHVDRGIPYRFGILLSGPPGCGKTSIAAALAAYLRRPIYALNLGSLDDDNALVKAMISVPSNAVLLLEDIDAARSSGSRTAETEGKDEPKGITLSALLNSLDGVIATEGRILVMTTNFPDKLDAALIRPGRVDLSEHIGPLGANEARRLFLRFFPEAETMASMLTEASYEPRPAAVLQGQLMRLSDQPLQALEAITIRAEAA
ncbi:AAA family ATPase [Pelagibius litoralis]|uniref:AAA family ATPase n=1 Tax=Pelagibius litoralis TaxID=374515 RepID=A0A967F0C2_9PROT|nr:AAA family ATPase [Pelagibius litoralis]NIA70745.1 AAA family ATPase [Pelagibius litoralis]